MCNVNIISWFFNSYIFFENFVFTIECLDIDFLNIIKYGVNCQVSFSHYSNSDYVLN